MTTSYPNRRKPGGIWKINNITQNKKTEGTFPIGGEGSRAMWGGGQAPTNSNVMEYVTIQTTGNATDFGNLIAAMAKSGTSDGTRVLFGGSNDNKVDLVYMMSLGNASLFGDLSEDRYGT